MPETCINIDGLTPRKFYRLHGTLPVSAIEALIDSHEDRGDATDVLPYLQDARAQFPEEGFLQAIIDRMGELAGRVRGENRKEAQGIAEALDVIQMTTYHAMEEGLSLLAQAETELKSGQNNQSSVSNSPIIKVQN